MDLSYYQKINRTFGVKTKKEYKINNMALEYNKAIDNTITNFEVMINTHKAMEVIIDNSIHEKVIIKQSKNEDNPFKEERIINFYPKSNIKRGSIINFNEEDYLVVSDIDKDKKVYYKGSMQKTTRNLKFMSKIEQSKICEYPAIIDDQNKYTLGVLEKKNYTIGDGRYSIIFPANEETLAIDRDDRFYFNRSAWKVTDVNTTTQKGLINLMLGEDTINTNCDDVENEIADRWKYEKTKEEFKPSEDKDTEKDEYSVVDDMGYNIHRFNTNTFKIVKNNNDRLSCNFEYKINYNGVSKDSISVNKISNNEVEIKNNKCKNGEVIQLIFIDKSNNQEIKRDIKLINF